MPESTMRKYGFFLDKVAVCLLVWLAGCAASGYVSQIEKKSIEQNERLQEIIDSAEKHGFLLYRYKLNRCGKVNVVLLGEIHSTLYDVMIHEFLSQVLHNGERIFAEGSWDRKYQKEDHEAISGLPQKIHLYGWDIKTSEKDHVLIHTGRVIALGDALMKLCVEKKPFTAFERWVIYEETECCKRGEAATREKLLKQFFNDNDKLDRYEIKRDYCLVRSISKKYHRLTYVIAGCFHVDTYQDLDHSNDRVINELEQLDNYGYLAFLPIDDPKLDNYRARLEDLRKSSRQDYRKIHSLKILKWYVEAVERVYGKKFKGKITYSGNLDRPVCDLCDQ